jgi:hypothetical protein
MLFWWAVVASTHLCIATNRCVSLCAALRCRRTIMLRRVASHYKHSALDLPSEESLKRWVAASNTPVTADRLLLVRVDGVENVGNGRPQNGFRGEQGVSGAELAHTTLGPGHQADVPARQERLHLGWCHYPCHRRRHPHYHRRPFCCRHTHCLPPPLPPTRPHTAFREAASLVCSLTLPNP